MKGYLSKLQFATGFVYSFLLGSFSQAFSCGVEWTKPKTHFDGVNEYGYVSYWDQIGAIDLGDGLAFPLIIGFRSDWQRASPYLGDGWLFGILDSHIIQQSENAFDMIQPDGYTVPFGRDTKMSTILNGAKGWKAEIKGNTITAYASCGWALTFAKGKIASITTPKNRTIDIRRDTEGVATEVVEGPTVLLKVVRDAKDNVVGLQMREKRIDLERVEKPRIQNVQGRNVIAGVDTAVGKITIANGQLKTFDYTLGDNTLTPALTVGGTQMADRRIVWDAATRLITSDGQWKYDVKPAEIAGHNAAIGRTDSKGTKEFWHYDSQHSIETMTNGNESRITQWFLTGDLQGKLRKIIEKHSAEQVSRTIYIYDENSKLLRESYHTTTASAQKLSTTWGYDPKGILRYSYSESSSHE